MYLVLLGWLLSCGLDMVAIINSVGQAASFGGVGVWFDCWLFCLFKLLRLRCGL